MKFYEWLYQKPNHWDDITNKEISDKLFSVLIDWINEQDNLLITIDIESFKIIFYLFLNNHQTISYYSDYEYFNLKFSDDIVDLFLVFKDITKNHGSMLLHCKNDNSNNLLDFIHNYCEVIEDEEEEDDNYNEEKFMNLWE